MCYGLYEKRHMVGFMAVLHQPHGRNKKIKRVSRLVILPDYQGIGIGKLFLNGMAEHYSAQGYDFSIKTSARNLIGALRKDDKWALTFYGVSSTPKSKKSSIDYNRKSLRNNTRTASFFYKKT